MLREIAFVFKILLVGWTPSPLWRPFTWRSPRLRSRSWAMCKEPDLTLIFRAGAGAMAI